MARRSCRNSALVRSYARKAGGDGSLQARFALRLTAPPCDRPPVAAPAPGKQSVRRRVCPPELRPPAASLAAGASRYPPPPPHGVVCPMAAACPMGILLLSSCPYPFGRQRFSSTQRTKKRPAERWSLWQFVALAVRELCADYSARSFRRRSSSSAS